MRSKTARETLTTLKTGIERALQNFQTKKAEFDAGVANSAPAQQAELRAARQRELSVGEAALAAADKAKVKWPVLVTNSDKNLEAIAKKVQPELQRLSTIDLAKLRQGAQLAEQGRKQIDEKNPEAADTLTKAIALFQKNELARRLQPEALTVKTAAASAAQAAAQAAATAARATPVPASTPRPRIAADNIPQAEAEKPFFLTIGGIITIIVFLAAGFAGWGGLQQAPPPRQRHPRITSCPLVAHKSNATLPKPASASISTSTDAARAPSRRRFPSSITCSRSSPATASATCSSRRMVTSRWTCTNTVEDTGIALGQAFTRALGEKRGIRRYGWCYLPMDETLARVVIDFSGRPYLAYRAPESVASIGAFSFTLLEEFLRAFTTHAAVNLHVELLYGRDAHHLCEAVFKGLAKAVDQACQLDPRVEGIPSTKGTL